MVTNDGDIRLTGGDGFYEEAHIEHHAFLLGFTQSDGETIAGATEVFAKSSVAADAAPWPGTNPGYRWYSTNTCQDPQVVHPDTDLRDVFGPRTITPDTALDAAGNLQPNVMLYARQEVAVTLDPAGGSSAPSEQTVVSGCSVIEPPEEPTRDGYSFAGWSRTEDGSSGPYDFSSPVTEDLTLYAQWTANAAAPVAVDDAVSTEEDTAVEGNVLSNDTDANDDALTAALVDKPSHGTVTIQKDGTFGYIPEENFEGTDTFTYTASDADSTSEPATVTITVKPVDDPSVAPDSKVTGDEDTVTEGDVLPEDTDADGDELTAKLAEKPKHGTVELHEDGTYSYTPDEDFSGQDSFTYTVSDGHSTSEPGAVLITVQSINDAPVAVADSFGTDEDVCW